MLSDAFNDIESLVHLEQSFYDTGYQDGFAHGRIHGLIEGRAMGRAKGFEMWEELGFYEGFALMWQTMYSLEKPCVDNRPITHTRRLLELIAQFPTVNPSVVDAGEEVDIPRLFRQIRSRYKALCSTLGVRPSLRYSERSQDRDEADAPPAAAAESSQGQQSYFGSVWGIDNAIPSGAGRALDF